METSIFFLASVLFILLTFGLFVLIVSGLRSVLKQTAWNDAQQKKSLYLTIAGFAGWLVLTGILAQSGFLAVFNTLPPRLLVILLPPIVLIVVLTLSSRFTQLLQRIPPGWLIGIQSFRVLMEIILWMCFLDDVIPVQMTFEGRNFDILVGLTAPIVMYFCFVKKVWSPKVAIAWNVGGLIILANIVIVAILSAPVPFRVFMNEPANTFIAHLPFVWLPAFVVPVAYWMHILSIKQLLFATKTKHTSVVTNKVIVNQVT
jgi:hypothetical protein